jgi:hypothetical protein
MRTKLLLGYGVLAVSILFVGCVVTTEHPADSAPPAPPPPATAAAPAPAPPPAPEPVPPAPTTTATATATTAPAPSGPPPKPSMHRPGSPTPNAASADGGT